MSEEVTETGQSETVEDTNTEVTQEETSDIPEEAVDAFNIDELINASFDEDPVMSGEHKIGVPYQEVLKHIPENGRKVIQNLRSSYTKKTQEIASIRADLEAQRADLLRQQQLLNSPAFRENIEQKANSEEKYDIWDTEGRQKEIERQAAKMMQQMLEPLQNEMKVQQRQNQLDKFKSEHPDLKEHRLEIAKMLNTRPELKLEDAYWLVKGRAASEEATKLREEKLAGRQSSREGLYKTSNGKNVSPRNIKAPKFKSAWEAYQFHKSQGRVKGT